MFERVITQTIQRISSEVLRDRQSVPLTEILEDERIPSRFKPFFATEVRWWLYNDALARSANKRFDVGHPEVASLLDYLEQVMFRHARFEHDEFVSTLDGAVKLTFNYLCRPQTTLKWYIFRGQPVKPLSEVMLRFESFLDYEYIGNVFAEWVERKVRERATFEAISATEFERIIRRIDDQILLSCTVDELLGLLDPIFDFIGEGEERNVPLDALIIFFDDKNIARLVDHLERYRETSPQVSRARFVGILEELLTSAEENPEADFSSVYQNDELDDIVQRHLEAEGKVAPQPTAPESAPMPGSPDPMTAHEVFDSSVDVVPDADGDEPDAADEVTLAADDEADASDEAPNASDAVPLTTDDAPHAADEAPDAADDAPDAASETSSVADDVTVTASNVANAASDDRYPADEAISRADDTRGTLEAVSADKEQHHSQAPTTGAEQNVSRLSTAGTGLSAPEESNASTGLGAPEESIAGTDPGAFEESKADTEDDALDASNADAAHDAPDASNADAEHDALDVSDNIPDAGDDPEVATIFEEETEELVAGIEAERLETASASSGVIERDEPPSEPSYDDADDDDDDEEIVRGYEEVEEDEEEPTVERPWDVNSLDDDDEIRPAATSSEEVVLEGTTLEATEPDVREHGNVGQNVSHLDLSGGSATTMIDAASIDDVVSTLEDSSAGIDETASQVESGIATAAAPAIGLDPMLERKVLKKIFNRDRAAYDEAMLRLGGATSWRQASQVLDELFIRFDVDPYSRTALRFTDSIYTRFVPKGNT